VTGSPNGAYVAPAWLPGGHAQTLYPSLRPRPEVRYRRQRIDTPDGDFVDFDWLDATGPAGDATPLDCFCPAPWSLPANHLR